MVPAPLRRDRFRSWPPVEHVIRHESCFASQTGISGVMLGALLRAASATGVGVYRPILRQRAAESRLPRKARRSGALPTVAR